MVLSLEHEARSSDDPAAIERALRALDDVNRETHAVRVPLSYAEELFNLRMHIRFVRQDLQDRTANE